MTYAELKNGIIPKNFDRREYNIFSNASSKKYFTSSHLNKQTKNSPSYIREYSSCKYNGDGPLKQSREELMILNDNKSISQYACYPYEPVRKTYSPLRDSVKEIILFLFIDILK